jgi:hypothetical protein
MIMDYNIFIQKVRAHLEEYKNNVLGISEKGFYRKKAYGHILPEGKGFLNISLPASEYTVNGSLLELQGCLPIKLHIDWRHMNSSQILCVCYFYSFIKDKIKLQKLVTEVLKINSAVKSAEFEYVIKSDKTNVDFVVHLENEGDIFFEIKYTEREFGTATSPKADYMKIKNDFHSSVNINNEDYLKHYQLIRNICLSPKSGKNHTVFVLPKSNSSINESYKSGISSISNTKDFNIQCIYWEDLLEQIPDSIVFDKYFNFK